uniref:Uncharacterized protein n=1 Tax=Cucumis sativus TaxID=3659 RepID=A0A0A0LIL8_CUCSA
MELPGVVVDSARSWFQKFQNRVKGTVCDNEVQDVPSIAMKQKVEVAQQYIENHYKSPMKSLQDRKERCWVLERRLADADVYEENQINVG